ncbi:MAG TPA: tetratricopeptide repeat protein, partial [Candidatus Binatia bacterium]|nr:tetratricopeptide repeat protein [Candidatus Binatia bacterium]
MGDVTRRGFLEGIVAGYAGLVLPSFDDDGLEETVKELIEKKEYDKAKTVLTEARAKKDTPEIAILLGQLYCVQEKYDQAIPELKRGVKDLPDAGKGWAWLTFATYKTQNWLDCIASGEKASKLAP